MLDLDRRRSNPGISKNRTAWFYGPSYFCNSGYFHPLEGCVSRWPQSGPPSSDPPKHVAAPPRFFKSIYIIWAFGAVGFRHLRSYK